MVDYEVQGRIALLTLNRPEARNAINRQVAEEMEAAIDAAEADDAVWAIVLRAATVGDRPVFCSGQDLKALGTPEGQSMTRKGGFAGLAKRARTKPLIVAVDGLATAGGCEIVLSCDLVIATTRSTFGLAEVKRNLIAGAGGLFRLPWAIGRRAAMEAILTGEPFSAERAFQLGLVNRLVEPGQAETEAIALAKQICQNAPMAIWASRQLVAESDYSDEDTMWRRTDEEFAKLMNSEDLAEGLAAFAEKRAPQWKGR